MSPPPLQMRHIPSVRVESVLLHSYVIFFSCFLSSLPDGVGPWTRFLLSVRIYLPMPFFCQQNSPGGDSRNNNRSTVAIPLSVPDPSISTTTPPTNHQPPHHPIHHNRHIRHPDSSQLFQLDHPCFQQVRRRQDQL